ncbi:inner membrane-spanning protein YciB [Denitrobaculum tricleocarpae]|uniref:Inner membrane-spanning protein YciB n=1 Tax=Denitrobaculum tricleocarpae TaxID=2591009 RepID=A0A545TPJ8_9PROT|nr:septation protein IspZ [Denitrobaculum tricleocarpae]TQV79145.1 septation protein A [Denitrobaculum tricleocarpae]
MMSFAERYLNRSLLLEICPALVFFVVNFGWGLMAATAAVMLTSLVVVGTGVVLDRKVPVLAVVTLAMVLLLGGASLVFQEEIFIKIKPTVGNCLFAAALGVGLLFRPSFLVQTFGGHIQLTEEGWRVLTLSWIALALSLAGLNEVVWRTLETDHWVIFRTVLTPFAILGYILITRLLAEYYWLEDEDEEDED